jgi:hypothetical protein
MLTKEYRHVLGQYRKMRSITRQIHTTLMNRLPLPVLQAAARKIGLWDNGKVLLGNDTEMTVLVDYALYDCFKSGMSSVDCYVAENPPDADTDQALAMTAMGKAYYSVLRVDESVMGAGVWVKDLLFQQEYFLADVGFSNTAMAGFILAGRMFSFEDFAMTSGAALPVSEKTFLKIVPCMEEYTPGRMRKLNGPGRANLSARIIKSCLSDGGSSSIAFL